MTLRLTFPLGQGGGSIPGAPGAESERMTCVLSIGEFARASGLTAKALRLYDELELLTPAEVDQSNGYRYYAPEQVEQARLVARLRSAGVPLPHIAAIIGASTPEAAADEVLSYWRHVEADRASARDVITSLVAFLRGQDNTMSPSTTLNISLADLIAGLYEELPDADDLARISEARLRAQTLSDLGEQLLDHYVSEAKLGGASWSEISDALGGTNQAALQRRAPNAFERFTDLNRHCIVLAQEAARTHKHELIGTEHLLLGLLSEPRGLAYEVLTTQTDSEQHIRDAIEEAMPPAGKKALQGHIAFRPGSKEAIEQALRVSSDLGHSWVGTEHTLLGLIRRRGQPRRTDPAQPRLHLGRTARHGHDRDHPTARSAR
jgi:DNA-binding transcriptional MerR regulator